MTVDSCWYKDNCTQICSNNCVKFNLVKSLYDLSGLPENQYNKITLTCGLEDKQAFTFLNDLDMCDFVNTGRNLYIHSNHCGNGKTSWSIRLMHRYFDLIWHKSAFECKALFINVPRFIFQAKQNISRLNNKYMDLCELIPDVDLVIWDDLPCGTYTDFENQLILQYLDLRINSGKSNIITGNRNRQECSQFIGERITSRIFSDLSVEFKEKDKRGMKNG